jgi:hypothetical protein
MDFWIARCGAADAAYAWPFVEPMLKPAIDLTSGLYEPGDIRELVTKPGAGTAEGWSLWTISEGFALLGAWTTHVVRYPREKVLFIGFAGGKGLIRYHDYAIGETEKFAREIGCTRMHGGGRRGWTKFGFKEIGVWTEKVLR